MWSGRHDAHISGVPELSQRVSNLCSWRSRRETLLLAHQCRPACPQLAHREPCAADGSMADPPPAPRRGDGRSWACLAGGSFIIHDPGHGKSTQSTAFIHHLGGGRNATHALPYTDQKLSKGRVGLAKNIRATGSAGCGSGGAFLARGVSKTAQHVLAVVHVPPLRSLGQMAHSFAAVVHLNVPLEAAEPLPTLCVERVGEAVDRP